MRTGRTGTGSESGPSPGIAAVLSLFIPGAGQMYAGSSVAASFVWLFSVVIGYLIFIGLGVLLHIIAVVAASASASSKREALLPAPIPIQPSTAEVDDVEEPERPGLMEIASEANRQKAIKRVLNDSGRTFRAVVKGYRGDVRVHSPNGETLGYLPKEVAEKHVGQFDAGLTTCPAKIARGDRRGALRVLLEWEARKTESA